MALLMLGGWAHADTGSEYNAVLEFAEQYRRKEAVQGVLNDALNGELSLAEELAAMLQETAREPIQNVLEAVSGMIAPVLMLAMLRCAVPEGGPSSGAGFLLRLTLLLNFSNLSVSALEEASKCLATVRKFTDIAAPAVTAVLAAMGLENSAGLISPAAVLAGSAAEGLFLKYGIPLCRAALCTAIAGNLCEEIDLSRFTALIRKAANWTAGIATTLFTSILALQGSMSESLDGVAIRTARFAVDSAAPVIGSGVSDAWDSYISGIMITKNALGISGITALMITCIQPVMMCLAAMLALHIIAAVLEVSGEKITARAAGEIAGVCQMALSLCTAALATATILLGAAMAAGKGLIG